MAIVEVTIAPFGTGSTSLSKYVAGCHRVLEEEKGLKYQLTPMGTVIEGELDLIIATIRKMHEVPFRQGAMRVSTLIRIDDRRDKVGTMEGKIASVENKLK
ncbi:MAG: MTH1187 family protein [Firmicutes bacterium]|nr:MTH1187 family protein [Bacillota bacterium]MDI6707389.1 MTH1187 family thiamine-binding protein [Bacillota bacterium]